MIHSFPLRRVAGINHPTYQMLDIELPDDLTQANVDRLYRWLRTLPIEDPKPLNTLFGDLIESNSRNAGLACGLEMIAAEVGIETPDGVPENVNDLTQEILRRIRHLRKGRDQPRVPAALASAIRKLNRGLIPLPGVDGKPDPAQGYDMADLDEDERFAWETLVAGLRCDECDPSFGCFAAPTQCCKRPIP